MRSGPCPDSLTAPAVRFRAAHAASQSASALAQSHHQATAAVALAYSSAYLRVPVDQGYDETRLCYLSRDPDIQWRVLEVNPFRWDVTAPKAEAPKRAGRTITVSDIVEAHGELTETATQWEGPCKVCGGKTRFHLNKRPGKTVDVLLDCRECDTTFAAHLAALGLATVPDEAITSEHALAEAFVEAHGEDWRFRTDRGWMRWVDGDGWTDDVGGRAILEAACAFGRGRLHRFNNKGELVPDVVRGGKATTGRGVAALVSAMLASKPDEWDADPALMGLPGGAVLELPAGTTRPATRADRITRRLLAAPRTEADYLKSNVRRVLEHVIPSDEHREYLQRRLGAALADESGMDDFLALHGSTRNGKGSLVVLLEATFGAYARGVQPRAILASQRDLHEGWKASLQGARLIIADELGNAHLDPDAVKGILGTSITAAPKNRPEIRFRINAPVLATSNHAPSLVAPDGGVDSRLKPIETGAEIPEADRDERIRAEMATPAAAGVMLWWLIEGYRKFKADSCPVPYSIRQATAAVRAATPLAEFAAMYALGTEHSVEHVYTDYTEVMKRAGGKPVGKIKMGNILVAECGWERFDGTGRHRMFRVARVARFSPLPSQSSYARVEGVQGVSTLTRESQSGNAPLSPLSPLSDPLPPDYLPPDYAVVPVDQPPLFMRRYPPLEDLEIVPHPEWGDVLAVDLPLLQMVNGLRLDLGTALQARLAPLGGFDLNLRLEQWPMMALWLAAGVPLDTIREQTSLGG